MRKVIIRYSSIRAMAGTGRGGRRRKKESRCLQESSQREGCPERHKEVGCNFPEKIGGLWDDP